MLRHRGGDEDELKFVWGCSVRGQVGWGLEHPGLVEGVPARGRGAGKR